MKKWYRVSLALAVIGIISVICFTVYGFVKYDDLKSLFPMGLAVSIVFLLYLVWDVLWIVLSLKGKIANDNSDKVSKYMIIILQIFTFASVYIGIAIGALLG